MNREGAMAAEGVLPKRRLPWFEGWSVVAVALAFQAFTLGFFSYCFTFWIAPWMEEFSATRGEVMFAMALGSMCISLFAPFAGRALDRYSVRMLVTAGVAIYAVGLVLISMATALWQIIAVYALAMSSGCLLAGPVAGQTLAVRWFTSRRGLALGLVSIGSSIGGFFLPPLVTALQSDLGWRGTHLALAVMALVLLLPLVWAVVRTPPLPAAAASGDEATPPQVVWSVADVLRARPFWITLVGLLPLVIANIVFLANLAPYAADLGIGRQHASFMMSLFAFGMMFGKVGVGAVSDLWDHRIVSATVMSLLVVALLLLLLVPGESTLFVACALVGVSAGSYLSLIAAVLGARFGASAFGTVIGLIFFCQAFLAAAAPLSGWLRDHFGSYEPVWLVLLGSALLCAPVLLWLRPVPVTPPR